jgi:hypothetical protein
MIGNEYNGFAEIFVFVMIIFFSCLAYFAGDKATQILSSGLVILIGLFEIMFSGIIGFGSSPLDLPSIFGGFMATLGGILTDSGVLTGLDSGEEDGSKLQA